MEMCSGFLMRGNRRKMKRFRTLVRISDGDLTLAKEDARMLKQMKNWYRGLPGVW